MFKHRDENLKLFQIHETWQPPFGFICNLETAYVRKSKKFLLKISELKGVRQKLRKLIADIATRAFCAKKLKLL